MHLFDALGISHSKLSDFSINQSNYIILPIIPALFLTNTEIAYLAGIIDGEGSIMLTRLHKNQYPAPCISIASTDLELLEWIEKTTCMGRIISKKNYNNEKHLDSYAFRVIYDDAIKILELIEPTL